MKNNIPRPISVCGLILLSAAIFTSKPANAQDKPVQPATAQEKVSKGELVDINSDFPGGNVIVKSNEGATLQIAPDLRTSTVEWPYWYFAAKANKPGLVTFQTPEMFGQRKAGSIGMQGPAISTDQGKTWKWMGRDNVVDHSFTYDFKRAGEEVRFSSSLPYVQADFDNFLKENAGNPQVKKSVLTKSGKGRDVELIQIGKEGPGIQPLLVTGRQHANESVSSYVLEGFLQAAMSDTPLGEEFRKKYVMFAVPFTDKDGVEEGDQGKHRKPHDHNRDWSDKPLYPETIALMELDKQKDFKLAVDFHCPTMLMDIHQQIYFGGLKSPPPQNFENLKAFAKLVKEAMPPGAPPGPALYSKPEPKKQENKHSHYFGYKEGAIMVCTLEFPYAPAKAEMNLAALRSYGKAILEAWVKMEFIPYTPPAAPEAAATPAG